MKRLALAAVLASAAQTAHAHVVIAGMDGFPGGLIHPLLVPAHALALFALGLLASQQPHANRRVMLGVFVLAAATAIFAVTQAVAVISADIALLALGAIAGALAAAARPLPAIITAALAAATGAAVILDSVPALVSTQETLLALSGAALGATAVFAIIAGLAAGPKYDWQRIGIRILGAWSAATAILVLALRLAR